jgi:hypothetical protein
MLRDSTVPASHRPRSPLAPLGQIPSRGHVSGNSQGPSSWSQSPEELPSAFNSSQQLSASLSMDDSHSSWPGPAANSLRGAPIIVPSATASRARTSDGRGLGRGGTGSSNNNLQEGSATSLSSSAGGASYVLRGGFKMPRQPSAPHM